jgi:expansin (peptidoglycan-binding protein)
VRVPRTAGRLSVAFGCLLGLLPMPAAAQSDCGSPVFYPAGATCSGGQADGRPCYVFDAGDNFGCPGGTCIASPGGGRATYYHAATGACGIPVPDPQMMVTAIAEYLWNGSAVCGRCARVTGPLGTVIVEITDLCPAGPNPEWCAGDAAHLDLSEAAFAAVADPARGVVYIEWEVVECPVTDDVTLLNSDGSNPWWYAVFALNLRQGVTGVQVRDSSAGATWLPGSRQSWNAFVVQPGYEMILPYDVRMTGITGEVLTSDNVITNLNGGAPFDMGAQFTPCSLFSDDFESGSLSAWSLTVP